MGRRGRFRRRAVLVIAGGDLTRLDAGAVALALARRLGEGGRRLLFVDADVTGSMLARRCGAAIGASFSPAERGLPTLIAARDPLRADALAAHCYSIAGGAEPLWLLFAPESAAGGRFAAGWLAEHIDDLLAIDQQRRVVVSLPSWHSHDTLLPLLRNASLVIHFQRLESDQAAEAQALRLESIGLSGARAPQSVFLLEGEETSADGHPEVIREFRVVGRLPFVAEEKLLRMRFRGRDQTFAESLERCCGIVAEGWNGDAIGSVTALLQSPPAAEHPAGEPEEPTDRAWWSYRRKEA